MAENKKEEKNLSPIEALQPTEKSLNAIVNFYKPQLMKRACDELREASPEKQDQFLQRLIMSIIKNDGLKECFNSPHGKASIVMLIDNCLMTGLELGVHAYGIPYGRKLPNGTWVKEASFQVKRQGYHAILCGGKKRIFQDLRWSIVYEKEKDNIKIDKAKGEVIHPITIDADRGKPIGAWVQAINLDGSKVVEFYPINRLYEIRDNHSKTYQDYIAKKIDSCPWVNDEIPMLEKTAIKSFCRPYADVKEALASAYYSEKEEEQDYNFDKKPVEDIAELVIDKAMPNLGEEAEIKREVKEEKEPEKTPELHDEHITQPEKKKDGSLFGMEK
jgi:recombinational DNA repair protein RecT